MTPALDELAIALRDVDGLIAHHYKVVNPGPGRPPTDEGPLLLTSKSSSPSHLPKALRQFVANAIQSDPWRLAGDDWRKTTVEIVRIHVRGDEETRFGINTAGPQQIVDLHRAVLGAVLLDQCGWGKYSTKGVKDELLLLVKIRGRTAHTGKALGPLHLRGAQSWRDWVQLLANQLDGKLEEWVSNHLAAASANSQ